MTLTNAELIGLVSNKNLDAEAFNAAKAELIRRIELRETNKDGEVEKLRAELRERESKLTEYAKIVTDYQEMSREDKERISELEAELAACKEDTNGFEAANAQLITDLVALDGEAEKLRAELRAAQEVNKKLQDSLDVVTFDFKVSSEQMFAWKHDASHLRERIAELEAERADGTENASEACKRAIKEAIETEREACAYEAVKCWAAEGVGVPIAQYIAAVIRKRSEVPFAPE